MLKLGRYPPKKIQSSHLNIFTVVIERLVCRHCLLISREFDYKYQHASAPPWRHHANMLLRQHHVLSTTTPNNCKKFLGRVTSWVIRVVLSVSYLLVSYFVMNFLRRIFSVCHSFQSMCQSGRMKGFERCFKVEDQGTWRRQNLHAAILRPPAKRIQIKLYEPHLGKEKPVMGNNEPLLAITKLS